MRLKTCLIRMIESGMMMEKYVGRHLTYILQAAFTRAMNAHSSRHIIGRYIGFHNRESMEEKELDTDISYIWKLLRHFKSSSVNRFDTV